MRQDAITILEHDPGWSTSFHSQAEVLRPILEPVLVGPLEHIGSTAVTGLPAKPIIDMLARVEDHGDVRSLVPALAEAGWVHAPEPDDPLRRKWSFCTPSVAHRTHHLHVVEQASPGWPDWLLFRDYLTAHPDQADRYARIKRALAAADPQDRRAYRSGKAPFIEQTMEQARAWAGGRA